MSSVATNFQPAKITGGLPWALLGAMVIAFSAIGFTAGQSILTSALSILLIASRVTDWRLPDNRSISRGVRIGLLTIVVILVGWPQAVIRMWYTKPEYTNLIGCALAVELVVRAWEMKVQRRGTALLLTVLIFGCAGNTMNAQFIPWLAPAFAVLILLSLPSFHPSDMAKPSHITSGRAMIIAITIAVGFLTIAAVARYQRRLELLTMDFFRQRANHASDIGLSYGPQLQAVFNPYPSMERIASIDGPRNERYLRVMAFDTFAGNKWGPMLRVRAPQPINAAKLSPATVKQSDTLRVHLVGDTFGVLPVPLDASGVICDSDLLHDEHGSLYFASDTDNSTYDVVIPNQSQFKTPLVLPLDEKNPQLRARCLAIPANLDPRIAQLAIKVAGDGDPRTRLTRIVQHLQANHQYSLQYDPGPGDPLADFILNNRSAHCQYFASAAVIMSRMVGIPARLATGYYLHESGGENRMVVRDRDAHAWAECWIDGSGWMTVDATPSAGRPNELFEQPSRWRIAWEKISDIPTTIREWIGGLTQTAVLSGILVATVFVLLSGILQIRRRKRDRRDLPYALPGDPRLIVIARRFDKWLRRQNSKTEMINKTWRESVRAIGNPDPCLQFISLYDEARFGAANGSTVDRLQTLLNGIEHSHSAAPPAERLTERSENRSTTESMK